MEVWRFVLLLRQLVTLLSTFVNLVNVISNKISDSGDPWECRCKEGVDCRNYYLFIY